MPKDEAQGGDEGAWWRGAVIYEVYPRSFQDGDGDGIGDLKGLLRRLEHVAALGVDAVWIAPFYASPMLDFGYDVADHCAVDPCFGTLADFDRVVARAHALGLRVLIDQVWSHTSHRHPWFLDSAANPGGPRRDWYVWADPRPDGTPPNNWQSVFGGPAWRWDPRRRQYYLHHFLTAQPALNLRHEAVLAELERIGRFWLERGVDGVRLDAADFLCHDDSLADNPPRPPPGGVMPVKPFGLQEHRHDMMHPDTGAVLARLRALLDAYPGTAAVAELSSEGDPFARAGRYTTGGAGVHLAYSLRLAKGGFGAAEMAARIAHIAACAPDGGYCWSFSNHDVERVASRWGDGGAAFAKLAMALLLCQQGAAIVYQGEELGLPQAEVPFERLRDPYGINFWPQFKGRDGARTPMPWRAGAAHAGFSDAEPWLPVPEAHRRRAVDAQEADPDSVLNAWRRFLRWRRRHPALRHGSTENVAADGALLRFERAAPGERLLCLFNCGAATLRLPARGRPLAGHGFAARLEGETLVLPAFAAAFAAIPPAAADTPAPSGAARPAAPTPN